MFRARIVSGAVAAASLALAAARAETPYVDARPERPKVWAVSVWVGPNSHKYAGAIFQDCLNLQSRGMMAGVTLDRKIGRFTRDIYLVAEIQIDQTFVDHGDTIFSTTLGIEFDNLFGFERTSFAAFTGPSYDLNPAYYQIGYKHRTYPAWTRKKFLNAVTAEFSSGLPFTENWDWTARLYHRSGVFGLYSHGDDDGIAVGLGLKYHF